MTRTSVVVSAAAAVAVSVLLWQGAQTNAQVSMPVTSVQPAPSADDLQSVTLVFGSKDVEPTRWDGSAAISTGRIEKVEGWHFNVAAKVNGMEWQCSTSAWPPFSGGMHPNEKPQPRATMVEPTGVTIYFRAPSDAVLTVKVPKGEFAFRPMDLPLQDGLFPLAATIEVYRTPPVEKISGDVLEDDYPSIAASGSSVWVAWQGYENLSEQVFLRKGTNGAWAAAVTITEKPGDIFGTAVAATGERATVVWSERSGDGWAIRAREEGSAIEMVAATGNNLFHRAAADKQGNLHVAYQSARGGRSDIYLRSRVGGRWQPEVNLSDPKRDARANDWSPAIAVDQEGVVWVAWDGYASGSYNVYLRSVRNNRPGNLLPVTASSRFHAHPSLAVDGRNRVWIAWDEAPENWGKDTGFLLPLLPHSAHCCRFERPHLATGTAANVGTAANYSLGCRRQMGSRRHLLFRRPVERAADDSRKRRQERRRHGCCRCIRWRCCGGHRQRSSTLGRSQLRGESAQQRHHVHASDRAVLG
jgi:hypothetical protein